MSVLELNGRVFDASTTGTLTLTGEGGAATTDVTQGLAKALGKLYGTGTIASRDSFNIAVLTDDTGTWNYTPNFLITMSSNTIDATQAVHSGVWWNTGNYSWSCTATSSLSLYCNSTLILIRS